GPALPAARSHGGARHRRQLHARRGQRAAVEVLEAGDEPERPGDVRWCGPDLRPAQRPRRRQRVDEPARRRHARRAAMGRPGRERRDASHELLPGCAGVELAGREAAPDGLLAVSAAGPGPAAQADESGLGMAADRHRGDPDPGA
ncbi:unnamed protein product, partial [Rotaria sp. Silwood1]